MATLSSDISSIHDLSAGVILTSKTIRSYIINYAKNVIFSTGPAFPVLAAVKAGYDLLASEEGETVRVHDDRRRSTLTHGPSAARDCRRT